MSDAVHADSPRSPSPGDPRRYETDGYVVLPGLVDPDLCRFLAAYLLMMGDSGRLSPDAQAPQSASVYGDPGFEVLLDALTPTIQRHVGAELLPTYSFARLYLAGGSLARHRDRPACEHSVTLHLGSSGSSWPLFLKDRHGRIVKVQQEPGDAVGYMGTILDHWREPLPAGAHAQVFLHWVRADGPYAAHALDGRPGLGREKAGSDHGNRVRDAPGGAANTAMDDGDAP